MSSDFDLFIPSYHRPDNIMTANYFVKEIKWEPSKIHVFIDSEADDKAEYERYCNGLGVQLHVFDMSEARKRYDYVHRPSVARRSAGQARNMFQDFAKKNGIGFYVVQDDDTQHYEVRGPKEIIRKRKKGKGWWAASADEVRNAFYAVRDFMKKHEIGLFGLSQTGDLIGGCDDGKIYRAKVMNTTFYNVKYIYRGERGVQDDDTSLFAGVMNEGLFTGSFRYGVVLQQMLSATQSGGLTDLYNECKLLNKALVVPIQFPSCVYAERQEKNGGRLHHHIKNRYLMPRIIKNKGGRDNIAWNTYEEDWPFTNEPKNRKYTLE